VFVRSASRTCIPTNMPVIELKSSETFSALRAVRALPPALPPPGGRPRFRLTGSVGSTAAASIALGSTGPLPLVPPFAPPFGAALSGALRYSAITRLTFPHLLQLPPLQRPREFRLSLHRGSLQSLRFQRRRRLLPQRLRQLQRQGPDCRPQQIPFQRFQS